ncbi:hypothetical protein EP10_002006 [Geobacillus icigianus]|uniref:Uncharacterized protein n=1 Tax=Geobacillus icigianus TaxID=1430331 RepID=A0ABU6BH02_9BACL|nr:hypothetical protein [Geobacillus icigianus]
MLLLSIVPPAKGAGVAGKAAIKGAKAIDAASALAKVKHVVCHDKMKAIGDIAFRQTVRSPLAETARLFKKQWDELAESVASVSWKPAYAGMGSAPRGWMSEAKDASLNMIKKVEKEIVGKREGKTLLPEEGKVGTYEELIDAGRRGDNITPHHMPSAKYIKTKAGIHKNDGVSMNMEHPHLGVGGRHRKTATYGMIGQRLQEYLNLSPRAALAHDTWDARRIYKNDGLYTREIRQSLKDVIRMNKDMYPDLFNK